VRFVVVDQSRVRFVLAALLVFGFAPLSNAVESPTCADDDACHKTCKLEEGTETKDCTLESAPTAVKPTEPGSVESPVSSATPETIETPSTTDSPATAEPSPESQTSAEPPVPETQPTAAEPPPADESTPIVHPEAESPKSKAREPKISAALTRSAMLDELQKNALMLKAIQSGDLKSIRRLIEVKGVHPTYVYGYVRNPDTNLFEAKPARLRLTDLFNDTNELRSEANGLDRILALFMELGMDVKATLATTVPAADGKDVAPIARTAWGPDFRVMEKAKDRSARFRAFEMTLQAGLLPNEDLSERLFTELPQVCGRDRSQFAIQLVDLMIKYLGPSLQNSFRRNGESGPETLSFVLDNSYASRKPKYAYEAEQFKRQDEVWEQCAPLSRRINRFLTQGN